MLLAMGDVIGKHLPMTACSTRGDVLTVNTVLPLRSIAGPHGSLNFPYILQDALIWQREIRHGRFDDVAQTKRGTTSVSTIFQNGLSVAKTVEPRRQPESRPDFTHNQMFMEARTIPMPVSQNVANYSCVHELIRFVSRVGLSRHLGGALELLDRVEIDLVVVNDRVDYRPEVRHYAAKKRGGGLKPV